MVPCELSDFEWSVIEPLLPNKPQIARQPLTCWGIWDTKTFCLLTRPMTRIGCVQRSETAARYRTFPTKPTANGKRGFSQTLYRMLNAIERFYSTIKHVRRIATHYEKKGSNYFAMVKLASTIAWMRFYESMTEQAYQKSTRYFSCRRRPSAI